MAKAKNRAEEEKNVYRLMLEQGHERWLKERGELLRGAKERVDINAACVCISIYMYLYACICVYTDVDRCIDRYRYIDIDTYIHIYSYRYRYKYRCVGGCGCACCCVCLYGGVYWVNPGTRTVAQGEGRTAQRR